MSIFEINIFGINIAPTYYGAMYAISFIIGYFIFIKRKIYTKEKIESLFVYIFLGVLLGGRLGYVFFYNFSYYLSNPLSIFNIAEGGMSFHGGVIGVIFSMFLFSKIKKESFLKLSDEITSVLPIGLFFGRIGNYLNKELLGYEGYNGLFAVYIGDKTYFPSPLLEAFLEGFILYLILFFAYKSKKLKNGQIACLFLIFYAIFRIFVELFFRQPDSHIGYIGGFITMGTILTLPMLVFGVIIFIILKKHEK